jgi:Protein of unknown function (DUF1461)
MRRLASLVVGLATALAIIGAALLLLMEPFYIHAGLDAAGSAGILGVSSSETYRLSDQTVAELFVGPGRFREQWQGPCPAGASCQSQPFYDAAEIHHMQDVRTVLWGFLTVVGGALALLVVGLAVARQRRWFWEAVGRGAAALAVGTVVVGTLFAVAFDPMFTLFHEIFFPGGDWAFDPATERLVQLYPIPFWELTTAALAALTLLGGLVVWSLAHRAAGRTYGVGTLGAGSGRAHAAAGEPGALSGERPG